MERLLLAGTIAAAALVAAVTWSATEASAPHPDLFEAAAGPSLRRFASNAAFERYRKRQFRALKLEQAPVDAVASYDVALPQAEPPAAGAAAPANPGITNNQTLGVDEGGIVKQVGRHLVVLQDGRLFSAQLGQLPGWPLWLSDRIDVYRNPATAADWYDEMLVLGDRILVTAYNYHERATEITVLRIAGGKFSREGRFLIGSDDYYSTDNYATRLVGDNLVFYAPFSLDGVGRGGFVWPRVRRADRDGPADEGEVLLRATDVYAPLGEVAWPVLHTVSVCPLEGRFACRTRAVVGPPVREIYVSPTDAFLWLAAPDGLPWSIDYASRRRQSCPGGQGWREPIDEAATLYRIPLDGHPVGAVAVDGVPADQFAFDSRDGRLRALLARTPAGCTGPGAPRDMALLDLPLSAFDDRLRHVAPNAYAPLPPSAAGEIENRFVGDWLIYGGRDEGGEPLEAATMTRLDSTIVAVPLRRPAAAARLTLPHNALRIERAGSDAVVTGYGGAEGLSLSYVALGGAGPRLAGAALLPRRFESEGRSHAFNAWIRPDGSGLVGLPTTLRAARSGRGWSDSASSELSFIAVSADKSLKTVGELAPRAAGADRGYVCRVSCVDWYGNSRPIFTGGRVFALMGTDLVEGGLRSGRMVELARLDLTAPRRPPPPVQSR